MPSGSSSWPGSHKPIPLRVHVVDRPLDLNAAVRLCARDSVYGRLPACLTASVMMMIGCSLVRRGPVGRCCTEGTPTALEWRCSSARPASGLLSGPRCSSLAFVHVSECTSEDRSSLLGVRATTPRCLHSLTFVFAAVLNRLRVQLSRRQPLACRHRGSMQQ